MRTGSWRPSCRIEADLRKRPRMRKGPCTTSSPRKNDTGSRRSAGKEPAPQRLPASSDTAARSRESSGGRSRRARPLSARSVGGATRPPRGYSRRVKSSRSSRPARGSASPLPARRQGAAPPRARQARAGSRSSWFLRQWVRASRRPAGRRPVDAWYAHRRPAAQCRSVGGGAERRWASDPTDWLYSESFRG
jgi:hypothetical protein